MSNLHFTTHIFQLVARSLIFLNTSSQLVTRKSNVINPPFKIWPGSLVELRLFLSEIDSVHETLKFELQFSSKNNPLCNA